MLSCTKVNESPLKRFAESFSSLQMEKCVYRQLMVNEYARARDKKAHVLASNPAEADKLKRQLINDYAARYKKRCERNQNVRYFDISIVSVASDLYWASKKIATSI